jgi:hypothetical protein
MDQVSAELNLMSHADNRHPVVDPFVLCMKGKPMLPFLMNGQADHQLLFYLIA